VRSAAEELGFAPSAAARTLLTGRTYTVGVITTDSYGRFSIPIMRGVEDALGLGEISAFLCDTRDDSIREQHYLRILLARQVDGIIVAGRRTEPRQPLAPTLPVPAVYAFAPSISASDCSVVSDQAGGAQQAVDHLVKTGRRRIAHITGPATHGSATSRAAAAIAALAGHGLEPVGDVWFGEWSESWGRLAAQALIAGHPDVDAVFCGSDQIARGVMDGLRESGRRLPDDVALVGVDNWPVFTEAARPRLTSVDLGLEQVGRKAGELLLAAIAGSPEPGIHELPCRLVIRESSAPPPGPRTA
jgi:LacI family transcriptional regulator